MPDLPAIEKVTDIRMGSDPAQQAWMQHFLIENNIDPSLSPGLVAAPEQLRFMVDLDDDQVYLPCTDALFMQYYRDEQSTELHTEYADAWRFIETLVEESNLSPDARRRVLLLCRYRFELYVSSRMILPSRLTKRLVGIVLAALNDPDPFREKKEAANAAMAAVLENPAYMGAVEFCPEIACGRTMADLRVHLDLVELERLFRMATLRPLWTDGMSPGNFRKDLEIIQRGISGCLLTAFGKERKRGKKILYLPDSAGGIMADLLIVKAFLRQGHSVVLALKDAFYFNAPVLWDLETDPALKRAAEGMYVLDKDSVTKNELLQCLRENRLVIISDGTSEQINLHRVSVTFARAWKECDLIVAKGRRKSDVLLHTSHTFTRNILCFWRDESGGFHIQCREKSENVHKYTENDLKDLADGIIASMRSARDEGKSVMFYSAIIGSIPGQTKTAVEVVSAFVRHLRERMESTFIINPAEHFEIGLDGDDLMFMWERVQRSGYLDVWRFQTFDDIEQSFALMGKKVPSIWIGKDATFSTGCTKEMLIAMDVQRAHPELQIIGPDAEKFFRRGDYGVGKYFDARIKR